MNIRYLPLVGSLVFSGLLTLGACGSSNSTGSGGGNTGTLGGTTGSVGGAAGGHVGAAGGAVGSVGGTVGSAGGTVGSAGGSTGAAGGSSGTGSCSTIPSCIQPLISCGTVSGTCVQQMTGTEASGMYGFNTCYSNGVKHIEVVSVNHATQTGSFDVTVSKGGTFCFAESVTVTDSNQDNPPEIIKNASGATVATLMDTADGNGTVVTCTGQAAVVVPDGCMPSGMTSDTADDCTDGVCQ